MNEGRGRKYFHYIVAVVMALMLLGVFFVLAPKVKAADDHIVINEIYPNPDSNCDKIFDSSCDKEWIELYNPTPDDLLLTGYTIADENHSPKSLSGKVILSQNYLLLLKSTDFTFGLDNGGDEVVLKNGTSEVDLVDYGDFNNNKSKSYTRIPNGYDSNNESDFRVLFPTKGSENLLPIYNSSININEIVPQPGTTSADEFIELYNSGPIDIDLSGWQIDDIADGGSSPFTIPAGTLIPAGGYLSFYNSVDHISYHDSGDTARLVDPNGDIKSTVSYGKTKRGQSYSKFLNNWQWTTTLTPNATNILTVEIVVADQDAPILAADIAGARSQPDGETVSITGIASVAPGILSNQYFYIQDGNSGIQIYNYSKEFPAISAGDEIRVTGEMATTSGERRIKISQLSDIQIISTHSPPTPINTTIDQIGENLEGQYIIVTAVVTKTSGSTFYIHGSGEIQVVIRDGTGIDKPKMRKGDKVEIAGILSQYKDHYRILPTKQSDVIVLSSGTLPRSGPSSIYYFLFIILSLATWNTSRNLLKKRKSLPERLVVSKNRAMS